jgi:hypothetical protein
MEITLRVAVMEDVAALQQLIPHSARELSQGFYTPQQIESAIQLRLSRFMIYCRRVKIFECFALLRVMDPSRFTLPLEFNPMMVHTHF